MATLGKGWFETKGRPGDRTLREQMQGLDPLFLECRNKSVLDIGCAEGLISIQLALHGASWVDGVEIVREHVEVGSKLIDDLPVHLMQEDANTWCPDKMYDIVIALALLHKLKDPSEACVRFVKHARSLVVLRLPPGGPIVVDKRSGNQPHDIAHVMNECGFALEATVPTVRDEWCGYWRRIT